MSRPHSPFNTTTSNNFRVTRQLIEPLLSFPHKIRNVCILAHVDHGKTTLTDSLLASNGIISFRQAGRLRYMDSREDEQERGITMQASAITLLYDFLSSEAPSDFKNQSPSGIRLDENSSKLNSDQSANQSRCFSSETCDNSKDRKLPSFKSDQVEHTLNKGKDLKSRFLINLIDSPGHVDFSRQVVTATRLCDGCLVLVDVVEGVCTQTMAVLRQAKRERLAPCLVINKMDRLITELHLSPDDASDWLVRLIEQINAVYATIKFDDSSDPGTSILATDDDQVIVDFTPDHTNNKLGIDSNMFDPARGNVVFSSSTDGWAFRIENFAKLFADRLAICPERLTEVLWGPFYYDKTSKLPIPIESNLTKRRTMFSTFLIEAVWAVYGATVLNFDEEKIHRIAQQTHTILSPRDLKVRDGQAVVRAVMSHWMPLSDTVFSTIVQHIPDPIEGYRSRFNRNLSGPFASVLKSEITQKNSDPNFDNLSLKTPLKYSIELNKLDCESDQVSENTLNSSSIHNPVEEAMISKVSDSSGNSHGKSEEQIKIDGKKKTIALISKLFSIPSIGEEKEKDISDDMSTLRIAQSTEQMPLERVFGMTRLFQGTLYVGKKLYLIKNEISDDSGESVCSADEFILDELYLLMGRDLVPVDRVGEGCIFGLGGVPIDLMGSNCKYATISCDPFLPPIEVSQGEIAPIVRVAVRPSRLDQLDLVLSGLRMLCRIDPCAETFVQEENGEFILATAGELHLEQCLKDLRERYIPRDPSNPKLLVDLVISPPMVPYRETISSNMCPNPNTDQWKRLLSDYSTSFVFQDSNEHKTIGSHNKENSNGLLSLSSPEHNLSISARAIPIPTEIMDLFNKYGKFLNAGMLHSLDIKFTNLFYQDLAKILPTLNPPWCTWSPSVFWGIGPRRRDCGANLLISLLDFSEKNQFYNPSHGIQTFSSSIWAGFQLATEKGPLAHEPMMGVAFILEALEFSKPGPSTHSRSVSPIGTYIDSKSPKTRLEDEDKIQKDEDTSDIHMSNSSTMSTSEANKFTFENSINSMIPLSRALFEATFLFWAPRLMIAVYRCTVQTNSEMMGRVYAALSRRHATILGEEYHEGTQFFTINSLLPVEESFGFADDLRGRTSGVAIPQLQYGGFIALDEDPYCQSIINDGNEHEESPGTQISAKYLVRIRERKGLFVERKIVHSAEKQRTLRR